jgi:hypothetical protein
VFLMFDFRWGQSSSEAIALGLDASLSTAIALLQSISSATAFALVAKEMRKLRRHRWLMLVRWLISRQAIALAHSVDG